MKIAVHITFFYDEKRIDYLKKTILGLKAIGADIFVHTNNRSLHNFIEDAQCIYHDLDGIHPFMLTRLSRPMMEKQFKSALYDYYMYIEDDIAFGLENFKYYLKYHETAKAVKSFIGFLRIEYDESGKTFLTDLTRRLDKKLVLSGKEFIDCSNERYQAMWLLDAEEMGEFISMRDLFTFKTCHYGGGINMVRENSAIGPLYEMFEHKLVAAEPGCFIHHIPNNYIKHNVFCKINANDLFGV